MKVPTLKSSARVRQILAAGFLLTLPLHADEADNAGVGTEIVAALGEATEDGLVERIDALGYDAIGVVFGAIGTDQIFVVGDKGKVQAQGLTPSQTVRLEHVLFRLEPKSVHAFLLERTQAPMAEGERKLAVRLLGHVGEREDLELLATLSVPPGVKRIPRSDRVVFQESFAAIYRRDGCDTAELVRIYREAEVDFAAHIIWAIGAANTVGALEHLAALLRELPEADPLILAELSRLGGVLPHPLPEIAAYSVRAYLDSSRIDELLVAIRAAQKLEDTGAAQRLIGLADHRVHAVAKAAVEALRETSGVDRGRGSDRWAEWYANTMSWWQWEAPDLLEAIEHGEDAQAARALLEVSKWRFHRHDIAPHVVVVLERTDPELLVLACAVLGHLGSWTAVPALVDALEDPSADIRSAAAQALRRITGSNFGIDREAWLALLDL